MPFGKTIHEDIQTLGAVARMGTSVHANQYYRHPQGSGDKVE